MVYLRQPAGYKRFCFYRITNGRIFIGATAVFNETYFPCCPDGKQRHFMELGDEPPTENTDIGLAELSLSQEHLV